MSDEQMPAWARAMEERLANGTRDLRAEIDKTRAALLVGINRVQPALEARRLGEQVNTDLLSVTSRRIAALNARMDDVDRRLDRAEKRLDLLEKGAGR